MATTSPDNLWTPDGVEDYDLTIDLATFAGTVQTALNGIRTNQVALRGLYANIPAAGSEGRTYYATDTNRLWLDDGSNWISNDGGMYLIRPTSVGGTGASLASDGTIVFTNVAAGVAAGANGLFSARFRSYVVKFRTNTTGTLNGMQAFVATGGTPNNSTGAYHGTRFYMSGGATANITDSSTNAMVLSSINGSDFTGSLEVLDPASASAPTTVFGPVNGVHLLGGTTYRRMANSAEDGLYLAGPGATWSGWMKVYGMA